MGKTHLCNAIANEFNYKLMNVNGAVFRDKYVGETEKKLNGMFQRAKEEGNTIIFLDEVCSKSLAHHFVVCKLKYKQIIYPSVTLAGMLHVAL